MHVGEVCLHTNDVNRLADFYKALLDIDNGSRDDTHQVLIGGETTLTVFFDASSVPGGNRSVSLAFTVANADAEHQRLQRMGVAVLQPPMSQPWGARNMCFLDVDGNRVYFRSFPEVNEALDES